MANTASKAKRNTNTKSKSTVTKKRTAVSDRNAGKKGNTAKAQVTVDESKTKHELFRQIFPFILLIAAAFLVVCFITGSGENPGVVLGFIYDLMTGLFSFAAFSVPVFLVIAAVLGFRDRQNEVFGARMVFAFVSVILIAVLAEIINPVEKFSLGTLYDNGKNIIGGGLLGGLLGELFLLCFKTAGSLVIVIPLIILTVLLTMGITPKYIYVYFKCRREENRGYDEEDAAAASLSRFRDPDGIRENIKEKQRKRQDTVSGEGYGYEEIPEHQPRDFDADIPIDEDYYDGYNDYADSDDEYGGYDSESPEVKAERINGVIYDEVMRRSIETKTPEELAAERAVFEENVDFSSGTASADPSFPDSTVLDTAAIVNRLADEFLDDKYGESGENDDALEVEREPFGEMEKATQIEMNIPKPEYKFPPVTLLSEGSGKKSDVNVRAELQENAEKLVRVLESFKVRTRLVGISRGPTITRYELLPEAGTRVRSISNLVDDISLNLATSGVRIEAPIPGKAAVGIEVPNKSPETVFLRALLSSDEFKNSDSKITACLGKDVPGDAIIFDIKEMPHLLVAGATGMGKSVCINSILTSILYKATPDEVKLILIDPKKVEFNIYNGLPHLLVPVVTDSKKAAGALNWAVNEMERRFSLIEASMVRNIKEFNEVNAENPDIEYMPQIIIVIDELADLMATAHDEVENSIARLAAKARAAGMHLIIGTQRPSVDVITGVIKANIPSRIACTVASQIDSRTIIDRNGAENLIGKGDMLFNPVGSPKPIRVQGAFVSSSEVEKVVAYIKKSNSAREDEYNSEVIKQIDEEAAQFTVSADKSSNKSEVKDEIDPLLYDALEICVEDGRASTSLLQRRLSVGYGRAAKIVDQMCDMGYVSEPDGPRPRKVLITKQEFAEIKFREDND